jgi:hypothetical protein
MVGPDSFGTAGLAPREAGEGIRLGMRMPSGTYSVIFMKPLEDIT